MKTKSAAPKDVDEYIAKFPQEVQTIFDKIRVTIKKVAPGAEETIGYQIPAFTLRGRSLVYVAAYKTHIGLYPAPIGNTMFKEDLAAYAAGKGTARFPLDEPMPLDLISRIVKFMVEENAAKAAVKGKKRS